MFMGAVHAVFQVIAFDSEVAILLALVAPHWLLNVFVHHDPGVGDEDPFSEEFVGGLCP